MEVSHSDLCFKILSKICTLCNLRMLGDVVCKQSVSGGNTMEVGDQGIGRR
jgi:hypothetical protein